MSSLGILASPHWSGFASMSVWVFPQHQARRDLLPAQASQLTRDARYYSWGADPGMSRKAVYRAPKAFHIMLHAGLALALCAR